MPIGAINQHLRLGEIFFGPIHPQPQRIALVVHRAEALTASVLRIMWQHAILPVGQTQHLADFGRPKLRS
jgi:hypothetical protein